ncbi:DHA2 family efflux MFS transporter permease subunit [Neobacillus sp. SAB-20_R2A]|uniref:DHA2 family efflux MFS transporter permease subunit n=1 Tax=Neobacillus sp. SAB-20_R2A TaxID=3120519 RepID=UPI003C6E5BB5
MDQTINKSGQPPYGIIAVLMVGAFIAFLNNTLLNIALPSIMKDLDVEASTVQWLTTGFMLVNGILIPSTAYLIQKYSVRRLFLSAMLLFLAGTILAGTAHVFPILLGGRMLQASGSAILMPLLMNVMLVSFPVEKRGTAMGVFGLILMSAPAIGPTLSGWIIEHYDWRMLFHFITPIAIVVVLIGFFLLKDKKEKVNMRIDLISLALSSLGFGGILYGFSSAGKRNTSGDTGGSTWGQGGWDDPIVYGSIIIGVVCLIVFIVRQLRQENPLLNFRVYKYPMFALSSAIAMVVNMALFSGMILLPIYVQTIRGISPMDAGLMLLPGAILMSIMSPITGKLFDKFGGRILALTGLTILTVTTFMFTKLELHTSYTHLIILYSIRMFGMSMVMMPVSTNGLNQLPARLYPHGTAMNNTLNQVAGAIGTALLVTVMTNRTTAKAEELGAAAQAAMKNATQSPTPEVIAQMKQEIMMKAMLDGINYSFIFATAISAVALVLSIFIKRAKQAEDSGETKPMGAKATTKLAGN